MAPTASNLPGHSIPIVQHQLPAVLRLGRLSEHLHHAIARILQADHQLVLRCLVDAQAHRSGVTQFGVHPAGAQRERVQPAILLVDPDAEPGRRRLRRAVGGVGKWGLGATYVVSASLIHDKFTGGDIRGLA